MLQQHKTKFYKELEKLQPRRAKVEQERTKLQEIADKFEVSLQSKNVSVKNKEIQDKLESFKKSLTKKVQIWQDKFRQDTKQEKFQSDLQKSFIVIIYGKVKAGKSTLGNFVAANKLKEQEIRFTIYDDKGEAERLKELVEFKTDILECTAQIQLFSLASLAWVDTPGLSSMTGANGELARSYINNADFVIFPTSSDSPLQQDEIRQIKELVSLLNKPFSLFITKSDKTEEDEVNGEMVKILLNKSEENRRMQEDDVKQRLESCVDVRSNILGEIISFSVFTAKEGLKNGDSKLYAESNIEKFYELLSEKVLVKADKLKSEAPFKGLVGLIDGVLNSDSLKELKSEFSELSNEVKKIERKISELKPDLQHKMKTVISKIIDANEDSLSAGNSRQKFESMSEQIKDKITQITGDMVAKVMEEFDKNALSILNFSSEGFGVSNRYISVVVEPGLFEKAWRGVKRVFGYDTPDDIKKFAAGDNRQELLNKFNKMQSEFYTGSYINDVENAIRENLVKPFGEILESYGKSIEKFEKDLKLFEEHLTKDSTC